jgi:bifunctional DNase/RNase
MAVMSEPIRMEVKGLMVDPTSNAPIVILRDQGGQLFLPIWIGLFEANAIALRLEGIEPPRPLTHDLLRNVLQELDAVVDRVTISDLRGGTFYAQVRLRLPTRELTVDARPSDAIALALRTESPIFVNAEVMEKARTIEVEDGNEEEAKLRRWLEELAPEDLGKYTM